MFKQKHQAVLAEYEKFWERKNTDRAILGMAYTKPNTTPYRAPVTLEEQWLDPEYNYAAFKRRDENSVYLAEGIPGYFTNFGPGCLSACMGGSFQLAQRTVWFDKEQFITDWENPPAVKFDEQSEMWQHITKMQARFAADPDVCFSITDLGGIMDIVASLRGTENLLYDLYDYPDEVYNFTKEVRREVQIAYNKQVETIRALDLPFITWMNIPSEKPWYPMQSDFSYMISPTQFEKFVLPELVDQASYLDRAVYQLDGIGERPHLDMILDIPGLNGIQWNPGAGKEPLCDEKWFDIYRKIQDKGKNIILLWALDERLEPQLERFFKTFEPTGLYLSGNRFSSQAAAERMLENIIKWSK